LVVQAWFRVPQLTKHVKELLQVLSADTDACVLYRYLNFSIFVVVVGVHFDEAIMSEFERVLNQVD